jgi:hypothetical protein
MTCEPNIGGGALRLPSPAGSALPSIFSHFPTREPLAVKPAGSAFAMTIGALDQVAGGEFVAAYAMSFIALPPTRSGARTLMDPALSSIGIAPSHILFRGDGFQVVGIAAARDAAEVVDHQPIWNRPLESFVRSAVDANKLAANISATITLFIRVERPYPAGTGVTASLNGNARHDIVGGGHLPLHLVRKAGHITEHPPHPLILRLLTILIDEDEEGQTCADAGEGDERVDQKIPPGHGYSSVRGAGLPPAARQCRHAKEDASLLRWQAETEASGDRDNPNLCSHPRGEPTRGWLERRLLAVCAPCAVKDKGAALSRKTGEVRR